MKTDQLTLGSLFDGIGGLRNWTPPSVWRTASTVTAGRSVRKSVTVSDPLFWRT